jgi:hypothetical protein
MARIIAIDAQKKVGWLDIAVNNAMIMSMLKRIGSLIHKLGDILRRQ